MKERAYGAVEWTVSKTNKVELVVGSVGLVGVLAGISGAAPIVALSAVSYLAGKEIESWAKEKS